MRVLAAGLMLLATACHRAPSPDADASTVAAPASTASASRVAPDASAAAPEVPAVAAVPATADAAGCYATRAPAALRDLACIPEGSTRTRPLGLSKDGRFFGWCVSPCDTCGAHCDLLELATGAHRRMSTGDEQRGEASAAEKSAEKFLEEQYPAHESDERTLHGPFPYADVVFVAEGTFDKESSGRSTLRFGARVGDDPPVYPFSIALGPHPLWNKTPTLAPSVPLAERKAALAEAIKDMRDSSAQMAPAVVGALDVSPDGKQLGVVAFATGYQWFEAADMMVMPTTKFVARVLRESARVARESGREARAVELLAKAKSVEAGAPPK